MAYKLLRTDEFTGWLGSLDKAARGRIEAHIKRAKSGNFGDHKSVGDGVFEMRINFGPGYRLYYYEVEKTIYLLLAGGDKNTQEADIRRARGIKEREAEA